MKLNTLRSQSICLGFSIIFPLSLDSQTWHYNIRETKTSIPKRITFQRPKYNTEETEYGFKAKRNRNQNIQEPGK